MSLEGPDFSDSRYPIFSYSRDPMIIFSDSSDPIFNSRDPNRVPKTPLKKPVYILTSFYTIIILEYCHMLKFGML